MWFKHSESRTLRQCFGFYCWDSLTDKSLRLELANPNPHVHLMWSWFRLFLRKAAQHNCSNGPSKPQENAIIPREGKTYGKQESIPFLFVFNYRELTIHTKWIDATMRQCKGPVFTSGCIWWLPWLWLEGEWIDQGPHVWHQEELCWHTAVHSAACSEQELSACSPQIHRKQRWTS